MPSVGNLNSSLTMTDNGFSATLNTGAVKASQFGKTINSGTQSFATFNMKALESRRAISLMAATAGASTGPLMHFMHAFTIGGPIIGGAIASILLLREVFESEAAAAEKAAKNTDEFHKVMQDIKNGKADIHEIGAEFTKLKQEQNDLSDSAKKWYDILGITWDSQAQRIEEIDVDMKKLTAEYLRMSGYMDRHIGAATQGRELGVLRLEHTMQARNADPMLEEAKKQTNLLQQLADKKMARGGYDMPQERAHLGSFTHMAGL